MTKSSWYKNHWKDRRDEWYKQVYKLFHGSIPKDEDGRSYDIHHIDGDCTNNSILNLIALSIQDHYDVHYIQGDWNACKLIGKRLKLTQKEISELTTKHNLQKVKDGTHPFLGGEVTGRTQRRRVKLGIHLFQNSELQKKWIAERRKKQKLKIEILNEEKIECPICHKKMNIGNFTKYKHGANCGQ